ncbi:hypothetical protein GCM10007860_20350 [Chitiniphilus shinanonensis]|uniref:HIG1 domain-containing protein n=2 Tax=Chitiniphilus shinanonensis TaxID=553088 RepID=A0ABQ6BTV9_9NEIS|nr:hypothetical protein [Chitiniphilus shinanonensis]GLS04887.1 hypothetical protein GCM10007860_20350 [Chitiniphilus shinanonensis]
MVLSWLAIALGFAALAGIVLDFYQAMRGAYPDDWTQDTSETMTAEDEREVRSLRNRLLLKFTVLGLCLAYLMLRA